MRRAALLIVSLLACESPDERSSRRAREATIRERNARTDCAHVDVPGECTSVAGFCPSGGVSATYHCASDVTVVVCPEDMPPPAMQAPIDRTTRPPIIVPQPGGQPPVVFE